ncbi:probable C-mannosyltransferase DPY19L1 [Corticium candelabrum]|uniref:probable C-mannosyltransferase DPY19L1 n=1 Tax=Corticium candelabrum TaxID=121492 RepID=UPI002E273698|nr:probable C-mannosyltransferase DPY19L1 [Corticium candelabrum]
MPKAKRAASAESRNGSTQGGSKKNVASLHVLQRYLPEDLSVTRAALIVAIAVSVGMMHRSHLSTLFENDRFFSHLSTLEREMSFRTEMGLYYSYYKTMVRSPSFLMGLSAVMYDNVTEYPDTINTLKRFNLYPEVALAAAYRVFIFITGGGTKWKACYSINRGHNLPPVESCVGIGDETYFYVDSVFALNGILMSLFFLLAVYLSDSIFGGLIATAAYFFNHSEATRVMWTPPLRESFSYPFLFLQMFCVTWTLRTKKVGWIQTVAVAATGILFMLPWQFAQFALLTQTVSLFGVYTFSYIGARRLRMMLIGQLIALAVNYILQFGNAMLLTSFFLPCLVSVMLVAAVDELWKKIPSKLLILVMQWVFMCGSTIALKVLLSTLLQMKDDAHIGDILKAKFGLYRDFHTQLYMCAREFGFMEWEFVRKTTVTALLPTGAVVVLAVIGRTLYLELARHLLASQEVQQQDGVDHHTRRDKDKTEKQRKLLPPQVQETDEQIESTKPMAVLLYHAFQLVAFAVIAVLIMRLKLFLTPHICLMTALLASKEVFVIEKPIHRQALVAVAFAVMCVQGVPNIRHQWSIEGEFNNANHEELLLWIQNHTAKNAVFAGSMPVAASVKLSTERPIVNHPHYEDVGLRERTHKVYQIYSRKPAHEIHSTLKSLGVNYVIVEDTWCHQKSQEGCSMGEVWDMEDEKNQENKQFCELARNHHALDPFKIAFKNDVYLVLQVPH